MSRRGVGQAALRGAQRLRQRRPVFHLRLLLEVAQLLRGSGVGQRGQRLARRLDQAGTLVDRLRRRGVEGGEGRRPFAQPHHRAQRAVLGVEAEQRLGQRRLHAQHVDQEAQGAQVVGQAVEGAGLHRHLRVDLGLRELVDVVAHVHHGLRGLVQPQHREHAAHRLQLARHRDQQLALRRIAEVLVDLLLDFGQRGPQLLHHAAHGLAVADAAVQLLHPGFQRLRGGPGAHVVDAGRQAPHAFGQRGMVELAVLERGVEVQDRGGDLHRQRGRRRGIGAHGLHRRAGQRGGQPFTRGEQALQRVADQRELFAQAAQAMQLAAGHRRPGVARRGHALAGLRDPRRVEAAQARRVVVDRGAVVQVPGVAHAVQARRRHAVAGALRVGAEEQQVLRQAVGQLVAALHQRAHLRQQARGDALGVDVAGQQAVALRLEEGGGQLPQRGDAAPGRARGGRDAGREVGAQVAHLLQRVAVGVAHQRQHQRFHDLARGRVGRTRRGHRIERRLLPAELVAPQIGRVHAVGAGQLLQVAVLREQRHRRQRLAGDHARQVVHQREGAALDRLHRLQRDERGLAHQALHRRLAGAQQARRRRQADQLERAHALVDLHARRAHHRRIDAVDVGSAQRLGFLQVAPQRLVRRLERLAQLALHPGQRADVVARRRSVRRNDDGVFHGARRWLSSP